MFQIVEVTVGVISAPWRWHGVGAGDGSLL